MPALMNRKVLRIEQDVAGPCDRGHYTEIMAALRRFEERRGWKSGSWKKNNDKLNHLPTNENTNRKT